MALVCIALQLLVILILVRIVLSWFPPSSGSFSTIVDLVYRSTEWLLGPLRRIMPPVRMGGAALDLSPMIVLIVIQLIVAKVCGPGQGLL